MENLKIKTFRAKGPPTPVDDVATLSALNSLKNSIVPCNTKTRFSNSFITRQHWLTFSPYQNFSTVFSRVTSYILCTYYFSRFRLRLGYGLGGLKNVHKFSSIISMYFITIACHTFWLGMTRSHHFKDNRQLLKTRLLISLSIF